MRKAICRSALLLVITGCSLLAILQMFQAVAPAADYFTAVYVEWGGQSLVFEGATVNDFQTSLSPTDPTADRTVTIPDADGALALTTLTITADADGKTIAAAEAGDLQTNTGAVGGGVWNLPEASTVIGKIFYVGVTVAQNLDINPDDADQILGLTNAAGDAIRNATVGNSITLIAGDATNWIAMGPYGTWTDVD